MFERFTDRARRVMGLANHEAVRFNHESVGTEHILLGLIKEGSGVAANVLRNLGIDLKRIRMEIEKKVPAGQEIVNMGRLPFTPRAKKVIELSFEESRALGHNYVGTEHLLLGLVRESEGVAAQVLVEQGLKLDEARKEVMRLLGHEMGADAPQGVEVGQPPEAASADRPRSYTDKARRVMGLANHEAVRFNHESVGSEHILLGLIKEGSGVGANVLRNLGVDVKHIRMEIEKRVPSGGEMVTMGRLPFTPSAKKAIELAFEEARSLGHNYVGTGHLLLGLLRESEGVAAQVLVEQGAKLEDVREEVQRLLDMMETEPEVSTSPAGGEIAPGGQDAVPRILSGRAANAEEARRKSALEGFTDESRRVMGLAGQEARRLDRREVDADHLFLGLMRQAVHDDSSVAARVLRNLGVDAGRVRTAAEKRVAIEQEAGTAAYFPLTQEAYKAIQMAREESRALGHDYLGPEHLLLGLLEERQSAAAEVFAEQGIQCERVREQVRRVAGTK